MYCFSTFVFPVLVTAFLMMNQGGDCFIGQPPIEHHDVRHICGPRLVHTVEAYCEGHENMNADCSREINFLRYEYYMDPVPDLKLGEEYVKRDIIGDICCKQTCSFKKIWDHCCKPKKTTPKPTTTPTTTITTKPELKCDVGWEMFGEDEEHKHCITAVKSDEGVTWQEAEDNCVQTGGHLVSINSEEENQFIHAVAKQVLQCGAICDEKVWIGYKTDKPTPGNSTDYKWSDGTKRGYENWASNAAGTWTSPDAASLCGGGKREACAQFFLIGGLKDKAYQDGKWNDLCCARKLMAYACTKKPRAEIRRPFTKPLHVKPFTKPFQPFHWGA